MGAQTGGVKMTSFRRLVMGIAETIAVLSIFFGTFVGGIYGAASGAFFRSDIFGIASNVDIRLQGGVMHLQNAVSDGWLGENEPVSNLSSITETNQRE